MKPTPRMPFAALFCAIAAMTASADVLVFKSGARLVGKVDRIEGGEIKFKSDDVGDVSVKQDKVASITTEASNTILYKDKTTEDAVVCMTNGQYTASGKSLDMVKGNRDTSIGIPFA